MKLPVTMQQKRGRKQLDSADSQHDDDGTTDVAAAQAVPVQPKKRSHQQHDLITDVH